MLIQAGAQVDRMQEQTMSDHNDYSKENADTEKRNDRKQKMIIISCYLTIWAFSLLVFWFFTRPDEALGYGVTFLWIVLPVTTLALSVLIGTNDYWGKGKWFSALFFGLMYMLAAYGTFSVANMMAFNTFYGPDFGMLAAGTIVSLIGLAIGHALRAKQRDK